MSNENLSGRGGGARSSGAIDWRKHHLWQIQPVRDVLVLLCFVGIVYLGYVVRIVTVPLLLALLLAYLFEPVVRWLTRRTPLKRQSAVGTIIIAVGALIVLPATVAAGFAVVQVAGAATTVASNTQHLLESVRGSTPEARAAAYDSLDGRAWQDLSRTLVELKQGVSERREQRNQTPQGATATPSEPSPSGADAPSDIAATDSAIESGAGGMFTSGSREGAYRVAEFLLGWVQDNASAIGAAVGRRAIGGGADAVGIALRTIGSIGYVGFTLFVTAFFFFFISTGYGNVLDFWTGLIPERKKGLAIDLATKMNTAVSGFVRGRLTIAAIQSVAFSIGYFAIGVPGWIILGPAVAILSIIPYAALVGVPISIVLLYLHTNAFPFQDTFWWTFAAPVAIYFAGQALDDYVLTPMIQGKSTGMDTPTILFASLAGGALAGVYGLLIAIPVAACIKILLQELFWPRFKRWAQGKETDFLPISN